MLIVSLLIASCNSNDRYSLVDNTISKEIININKEIIRIEIDSLTLHTFSYLQYIEAENIAEIIGYNNKTHAFDIIDLGDRSIKDHINLEKDGPNSISSVKGFHYYNEDSIFIFDGRRIIIIDSKGIVKFRTDLFSNFEEGKSRYFPHSDYFADLRYFPSKNSLYFRIVYNDRKLVENGKSRPLIGEFNFSINEVVNLLPVYASKLFWTNPEDYGLHSSINYTCGRNKIYYNFPAESNIYTIDFDGTNNIYHGGKSIFTKNYADKMEPGEDYYFKYYKEEIFFYPLLFPIEENYFIRLHWGELTLKKDNNEFSLLEEKPLYITIFDKELNYIKELEINNKDYYVGGAFCDNSAFYIFKNISLDSSSDEIILYKFNINFK